MGDNTLLKKLFLIIISVSFAHSSTLKVIEIQKVSPCMFFATCSKYLELESVNLDMSKFTAPYSLDGIKQILTQNGWNMENFEFRSESNGSALDPNSNFPILPKCLYLLRL